jgi:hypothetical protein
LLYFAFKEFAAMKLSTVVALPDANGRSWLGAAAVLTILFLWLSSNPLPQVAIDEMRVGCREQPVVLTSETGVPLTSERGSYLVADNGRRQCQPVVW